MKSWLSALVRIFSGPILGQVMLSAANFITNLLLLRSTSDADYGEYVLVFSALMLLNSLQMAVLIGPVSVLAPKRDESARAGLIDGIAHQQDRAAWWLLGALTLGAGLGTAFDLITWHMGLLLLAAGFAAFGMTRREFYRQMFLVASRPHMLLYTDGLYAALLVAAVYIATRRTHAVSLGAVVALGFATWVASFVSLRALRKVTGPPGPPDPTALATCWRLGRWSLAGAAITWSHLQGFNYLLAMMKGASDVAGVQAARLLCMPVNLLIVGVSATLLPQSARWFTTHGAYGMIRRSLSVAAAMMVCAAIYFVTLYLLRHQLVEGMMKRDLVAVEPILFAWALAFAIMIPRGSLMVVLQVLERFDMLTMLAVFTTATSLSVAYWGIRNYGARGSVFGVAVGEFGDLIGVSILIVYELRRLPHGKHSPPPRPQAQE